jgi:predicted helicase
LTPYWHAYLTLSGRPVEAHAYVLWTRSGIDRLIDRNYVKTYAASGPAPDFPRKREIANF